MKKQIIIIISLVISLSAWGQNTIATTTPCDDALLQKTPGRWIKSSDNGAMQGKICYIYIFHT